MTDQSNELTASYYRCRENDREGRFLDTFYQLFLAKSPDITAMFANTNFVIQKLMLRQSLLEMICFDRGMAGTREEIGRLGGRHKGFGVTPEMYSMWIDALCEAIRKHDSECTPELERIWRQAMQRSVDEMVSAARSAD